MKKILKGLLKYLIIVTLLLIQQLNPVYSFKGRKKNVADLVIFYLFELILKNFN